MNAQPNTITIADHTYDASAFLNRETTLLGASDDAQQLFEFLKNWFTDSPCISVKTSGSTGEPKQMQVEKQRMIQSALLTCEFLKLKKGDSALLCMPLDYIAGKMMVVRALVTGLNLHIVTPSATPLEHAARHFAFAAMTPMQIFSSLQSEPDRAWLMAIENLIIGGGAVDAKMAQALKAFPNKVYSTYGMTETLSHIAMRRLSSDTASECYYPFSSVQLSLSEPDNTLTINAPLVTCETLCTNDVAHINEDGSFKILGRKDNTINSGGIKIQAEEVEALLQPVINGVFAITSMPDERYGEIVVLAVENDIDTYLEQRIRSTLPKYFVPKKIIKLEKIPLTETQKIKRTELKKLVLEIIIY